jgi:hypothetical protein
MPWSMFPIQSITNPQNCLPHGGDGFAFVIQSLNNSALGGISENLGYGGIKNSVAVEFDTWYNHDLNDYFEHHISIQTGGFRANSPSHNSVNKIAFAVDGPVFTDSFTHLCRIRYDPEIDVSHIQDDAFNAGSAVWGMLTNGSGAIQIFVDDMHRPLLVAPIKLDTIITLENNTFAYVGVTASTGQSHQSVDISSFTYRDACPKDCHNVGSCKRGVCTCESSYSGASCQYHGQLKPQSPSMTARGNTSPTSSATH